MKTLTEIWRRITTPGARALEEEILPHIRAQEAEIARKVAEINRQRAEIERLRVENRALLNSILGIAGLPPIVVSTASSPTINARAERGDELVPSAAEGAPLSPVSALGSATPAQPAAASVVTSHPKGHTVVSPTRRRSWPQIHRALEIAAAQKIQVHEDSPT